MTMYLTIVWRSKSRLVPQQLDLELSEVPLQLSDLLSRLELLEFLVRLPQTGFELSVGVVRLMKLILGSFQTRLKVF